MTDATELLIAEESTGAIIGVKGLAGNGTFADLNLDFNGFEVGDEVLFPVNLKTAEITEGSANSGKLYAQYDSGALIPATVLSHSDDFAVSKANAVTITTQDELREFLSAENRSGNAYKMVRLVGKINFITYNRFFRFFFPQLLQEMTESASVLCEQHHEREGEHYISGIGDRCACRVVRGQQ